MFKLFCAELPSSASPSKIPLVAVPTPPSLSPTSELLVLTWGICFIANSRGSEPTMKGRNFSKSLKRGSSIVLRKKRKLGRPSPPTQPKEERPQWDNDNVCISSDSESGEHVRERTRAFMAAHRTPYRQVTAESLGTVTIVV